MKNLGLDIKLQYLISDYLIKTSASLDAQDEFKDFEQIVPPSHRSAINEIIYKQVKLNELFEGNPIMSSYLLKKVRNEYYKPETPVVTQGDKGDEIFFIANGRWDVSILNI